VRTEVKIPRCTKSADRDVLSSWGTPGVTVYIVAVRAAGGEQWEVQVRFRDFEALHTKLKGTPGLPFFPSKQPVQSLVGLREGVKEVRRADRPPRGRAK
jgi:hypothetical protein